MLSKTSQIEVIILFKLNWCFLFFKPFSQLLSFDYSYLSSYQYFFYFPLLKGSLSIPDFILSSRDNITFPIIAKFSV